MADRCLVGSSGVGEWISQPIDGIEVSIDADVSQHEKKDRVVKMRCMQIAGLVIWLVLVTFYISLRQGVDSMKKIQASAGTAFAGTWARVSARK